MYVDKNGCDVLANAIKAYIDARIIDISGREVTSADVTQLVEALVKETLAKLNFEPSVVDGNLKLSLLNVTDILKQIVTSELSKKQDLLTFDSEPRDLSNNPVYSQGIKNYLDRTIVNRLDEMPECTEGDIEEIVR